MTTTEIETSTPQRSWTRSPTSCTPAIWTVSSLCTSPRQCSSHSPVSVIRGHAAIAAALAELIALRPRMITDTVQVLETGDIALVVNEWTMTGTAPDGAVVRRGGRSADVLRRQPDGRWLVVVDKP
jgi:hypothetical protein